ncbi:alpha/beta hydrolase family protein [Gulosibacter faecalis]|jgi:pimeloyl-ACP methyl ester carboxylesterase|uniref:Alpha/beta hydrolase family protein n=1 Tax=Gulosibacter faecalis TaxID=272240 RepID=A0ABW5UZS9_9MICO|nr:alpha/beta fold hydrolase [Gulosibacter faecalis]
MAVPTQTQPTLGSVRQFARNATAVAAGGTVFFASLAATAATMLARQVVNPPRGTKGPVRVISCDLYDEEGTEGVITLERTIESETAGEYTLLWDGAQGRARLGEIMGATLTTVSRRFGAAVGTPIAGTRTVRVASAPQRDIRDLGVHWREVEIPTELGEMPAWFVPADREASHDWVIHVHGRGAALTEPLRAVPIARAHGWNSLVVSYRNDLGVPSPDPRKYGLGLTEWRDVDAAIEWARSRGAERIVLTGWSMGGAIVGQTYLRSEFRPLIAGIMFESPALNWRDILVYQAGQMRVPSPVAKLGMWLLGSPLHRGLLGIDAPIDLAELDLVERADEFDVPVLLLHSTADTVVPVSSSQEFAQSRPDLVDYVEFTRARHTRLWNTDRESWETAVDDWFAGLREPAQAPSATSR